MDISNCSANCATYIALMCMIKIVGIAIFPKTARRVLECLKIIPSKGVFD